LISKKYHPVHFHYNVNTVIVDILKSSVSEQINLAMSRMKVV